MNKAESDKALRRRRALKRHTNNLTSHCTQLVQMVRDSAIGRYKVALHDGSTVDVVVRDKRVPTRKAATRTNLGLGQALERERQERKAATRKVKR